MEKGIFEIAMEIHKKELKPCWHCGASDPDIKLGTFVYIECRCGALSPKFGSIKAAKEWWNTRAQEDRLNVRNDMVTEGIKNLGQLLGYREDMPPMIILKRFERQLKELQGGEGHMVAELHRIMQSLGIGRDILYPDGIIERIEELKRLVFAFKARAERAELESEKTKNLLRAYGIRYKS